MKKILLSFLLLGSGLCMSMTTTIVPDENSFEVDLTRYKKLGFLIIQGDYKGKYEEIKIIGTVLYQNTKSKLFNSDNPKEYYLLDGYYRRQLSPQTLVDTLYNQAKSLGADALVNFRFEMLSKSVTKDKGGIIVSIKGYQASGYAIKRENE